MRVPTAEEATEISAAEGPRRRRGQRLALGALLVRQVDIKRIGIWEIIETRSQPTLTRSYPRRFTFYVAHPTRSIQFHGLNLRSRNALSLHNDWLIGLALGHARLRISE
jgi:hypothetical protein